MAEPVSGASGGDREVAPATHETSAASSQPEPVAGNKPPFISPEMMEGFIRLFLVLATATVFRSSLRDNFVAGDDNFTFYQNPYIQKLDWPNIRWMFTNIDYSMRYKPLSWLLYA